MQTEFQRAVSLVLMGMGIEGQAAFDLEAGVVRVQGIGPAAPAEAASAKIDANANGSDG